MKEARKCAAAALLGGPPQDAAWKTIELRRDGVCVMCEGSGQKTKSKEKLAWEILSNRAEHKGALAIVGKRGGKPWIPPFSREAFAKEYPAQMDPSLNPAPSEA